MDDADLGTRVERCLRDADPDLANMWRECVVMYGVKSAAAVGCLSDLVAAAWGDCGVYARKAGRGGWTVCVLHPGPGCVPVFAGPFGGPTKVDALVVALESKNP